MRRNWSVIKAHGHAPQMVEALVFGLLVGWIYSFAPLLALAVPTAFSPPSLGLILLVAALCAFQRPCWHFGMHAIRGSVLGTAACAALLVALPQEIASEFSRLEGALSCLAVGALLGALSSILLLGVRIALLGRPVLQDGSRCPKCAYVIDHLPEKRCPECGTAFTDADIAPIPPSLASEWRRARMRALVCLSLFGASYFVYPYVLTKLLVGSPAPNSPEDWDIVWMRYLNRRPQATARILTAWLERTDRAQRARAAEVILGFKGPDALLEDRLGQHAGYDPDSEIRQMCLQALSSINAERLAELMPGILADRDPEVRWTALGALASGGSWPRALGTPWLIKALDDADEQLRGFAYKRLCENTRQQFPFDSKAPRDERLRDQATWMEWWDQLYKAPERRPVP